MVELISIVGVFLISFVWIRFDLKKSIYLLLFLSILLHKELFSFFTWDLLPVRAYVFALFCSVITSFIVGIFTRDPSKNLLQKIKKDPASLLLLFLAIVSAISVVFSLNLKASVLLLGFFVTSMVLFAVLVTELSSDYSLSLRFLKFYIFLAFCLTLFGYFQYYLYATTGKIVGALWNIPNNIPRVGATFWDVNHYGAFIAALLPISGVLVFLESKWRTKLWYFIVSVSLLVTLLLTNSRTSWIFEFIAFMVFAGLFLVKKWGRKGLLILIVPFILSVTVMGYQFSIKDSVFRTKVKQYFHYRLDSFESHILLLRGSVEIFAKYPVLGGGYGGFFEHFGKTKVASTFFGRDPAAFSTRVPPHTIWGELLSGTGIVGFVIFTLFSLIIIGVLIFNAFKSSVLKEAILSMTMASVIIGWLTGGIFYSYNSEFFWIILALFYSYGLAVLGKQYTFKDVLYYFNAHFQYHKLFLLLTSISLIFIGLGSTHLIPWDEAIYAKISKNILESGDMLSLFWKSPSATWFEKPPLYMWISSFLMGIFGVSSWAVRLPSAIFGILTVLVTYDFGRRFFGKTAGFIAGLSLLTTTHFLYYSRIGMLDVTVTFFITLSLYLFALAYTGGSRLNWFFSGSAIGAAVMTKGVVGLIPLVVIVLASFFLAPKFRKTLSGYVLLFIGIVITSLPWHMYMYLHYGDSFLSSYIGYHVLDRATTAIEDKGNPIWWYFIVLKVSMRIWFVVLLPAYLYFVYIVSKNTASKIIFFWSLTVLALFSFAQSKLIWYIMPIYPALAIINGYFISRIIDRVLSISILSNRIDKVLLKFIVIFAITLFSFTYLFLVRNLVYTGDQTGAQAKLMELKEELFGVETTVYLDRIELPLAYYYLEGPFEVVDFLASRDDRVPEVKSDEKLILITKAGRYSEQVAGYDYLPTFVKQEGDWILWYMNEREEETQ